MTKMKGLAGFSLLFLLVALFPQTVFSHDDTSRSSAPVIIEVTNQHFTAGQQIPSAYLKVFADRTVECHTLKFTGHERDAVKKGQLTEEEFRQIKAAVGDPDLRKARARYELTHSIIDSWMEWNIKIPRSEGTQDIAIADFGSTALRVGGHYPRSVLTLGCMILKIRDEVFSDAYTRRRRSECEKITNSPKKACLRSTSLSRDKG